MGTVEINIHDVQFIHDFDFTVIDLIQRLV